MALGKIGDFVIGTKFKSDKSSISKVNADAEALKKTLSGILGAIGIAFTVTGVKKFIEETSAATAEFRATNAQIKATFGDLEQTARNSMQGVADATGISVNRIKQTYTSMASFAKTSGMDTAQANEYVAKAMEQIANNAAYMDVSVEEAAETYQRLLKGNFQVDDKMNFNFTEDQRNALSQSMYGANFADLEDAQKFEVVYQKLLQANEDMGAYDEKTGLGQAASEADEYTNQVAELSDAMQQLKVSIGGIFLDPLLKAQTKLAEVMHEIAEGLGDVDTEGSIVKRLSEKLTAGVERLLNIADRGINIVKQCINFVGGLENALKLLSVVLGVVAGFMLVDKITKVAGALSKVNWRLVGIIAVALALFLIIQDFMVFMAGGNSVTGDLIKAAGFDPDAVRDKINRIKDNVLGMFDRIKEKAGQIKQKISDVFSGVKINVKEWFSGGGFADLVQQMQGPLSKLGGHYKMEFSKIKEAVLSAKDSLSQMFGSLKQLTSSSNFQSFLSICSKGLQILGGIIFAVATVLSGVGLAAIDLFSGGLQVLADWVQLLVDLFTGDFSALGDDVSKIFDDISSTVDSALSTVAETIEYWLGDNLAVKALKWGADMVSNFISGIGDFAGGVAEKIGNGIQWLSDNVGHSKPKKGPLKDDDKWMPDMMNNFINGINAQRGELRAAVDSISQVIAGNANGLSALGENGAGMVASNSSSRSVTVNQYNSFSGTFNGDTRSNQVNAAGALKSSATDSTAYLANAIAFGR